MSRVGVPEKTTTERWQFIHAIRSLLKNRPALVMMMFIIWPLPCHAAEGLPRSTPVVAPQCPRAIVISNDAAPLERLAANEVRRYVYLRTGKLLPLRGETSRGERIVVATKERGISNQLGRNLQPGEFLLKTTTAGTEKVWWIVGGSELGTLYGAYRFAEKLGVHFSLDEDVLPDQPFTGGWPDLDEIGRPRFALRGLQPFHDFSVGPDWWNLPDYESILSQMAKLRMNFIGFHTYPSWNPAAGPEANVWIGLPEDVDAQGNVKSAYEAGVVTTRRGWMVSPFPTSKYSAGAGLLFAADDYGPDFMLESLDWPRRPADCAAMFNRYGDFQQKVFQHANRLGIKTCTGTELPLGIPPMLAAHLHAMGLNPDDPAVIRRLYEGMFLHLMRKSPVDYFWLWTPESWLGGAGRAGWEITTHANTERDLSLAEAAAQAVHAPFGLATCGWMMGSKGEPLWMAERTPSSWAVSSINLDAGNAPVEKAFGLISNHPKWVIGWAEDDGTAGASCCTCLDLQFWVKRILQNSSDAFRYNCDGMFAIHWRTAAIAPNIDALAEAGWEFSGSESGRLSPGQSGRLDADPRSLDRFWSDWGRSMFGGTAGADAGRILQEFDGTHPAINALYKRGTTEGQVAAFFAPLRELEALRPQIHGAGNRERFDYWLDFIRATRARAETWILASHLGAEVKKAAQIEDAAARRRYVQDAVLPLRRAVARRHEQTVGYLVDGAKSPGDVGIIAHLEYGVRKDVVTAHDAAIEKMLGAPLPPDTALDTRYHGKPRIFVSAKRTQMNVNEPQRIRLFVLSGPNCARVTLYWRSLGHGAFRKLAAVHQARQAYEVTLPARPAGALEYYLEAALVDGQKVLWPATAPAMNQTVVAW